MLCFPNGREKVPHITNRFYDDNCEIGGILREVYSNLQILGKQFNTKILLTKMEVMTYEGKYRFVEGLILKIRL